MRNKDVWNWGIGYFGVNYSILLEGWFKLQLKCNSKEAVSCLLISPKMS